MENELYIEGAPSSQFDERSLLFIQARASTHPCTDTQPHATPRGGVMPQLGVKDMDMRLSPVLIVNGKVMDHRPHPPRQRTPAVLQVSSHN